MESPALEAAAKLLAREKDRQMLVAYVGNGDIWVQQVEGSGLARITDDPAGASDPAFSPDGTQIAFRSERDAGGIYIAPALGGEAREFAMQGRRPRFAGWPVVAVLDWSARWKRLPLP
ncbi:MAG: hypothetical protein ABSF64_14635 [Bryobacteraceae bacterium]|jgi:Tol biopolymer transport system component